MRICLALLCLGLPAASSRAGGQGAELRGIWMHATQAKTPAEADVAIAKINRANFNAVFVLVWYWGGQAYFRSDLCPMGEGVPAGYDPLGYLVEQCHRRGIQVHAWFVNGAYGSPTIRHVLDKHPDWAVDDGAGGALWYDFGKPEVRRFQSDLMLECLRRYDVDGLHFDYIRYGPSQCYCPVCQREFARRYGFEPLTQDPRTSFPAAADIAANPLAKPTTAVVLAEFSDGTPAIALNRLGEGTALLLNWHAENEMPPAVAAMVKLTLDIWTTSHGSIRMMTTAETRNAYGNNSFESARVALTRLGHPPQSVPPERIGGLPAGTVLVLPAVYIIPKAARDDLEQFVRRGGRLLIIDGPVKSMAYGAMQRVTGFAGTGRYFHRVELIQSTGRSPLVPKSKHRVDLVQWRRRLDKWAQFRKWGVTTLVRDVYERAKALKPDVQVSAAVFSSRASADSVYQDWPRWLREKTIDFVVPMAYTEDNAELNRLIAEWKTLDPTLSRIIPGLSLYRQADGQAVPRRPELVREQFFLCRQRGAHGGMFFSLPYLNDPLVDLFRRELYPAESVTSGPARRRAP